jgi:hypothetical protein
VGFFDQYPIFQKSQTGSNSNRLNARYEALIAANRDVIEGARVLDIASHDGRWSFAAIKAGASHVLGIEVREHLISSAREAMTTGAVPADRYEFVLGDVYELIRSLEPGRFETVFCFGFLYHSIQQATLLEAIGRLRPAHLLIDTEVARSEVPLIVLRQERPELEGNAVRTAGDPRSPVLVGTPSRPALDLMLQNAGFDFAYYDWQVSHKGSWLQLEDYRDGARVTARATLAAT